MTLFYFEIGYEDLNCLKILEELVRDFVPFVVLNEKPSNPFI